MQFCKIVKEIQKVADFKRSGMNKSVMSLLLPFDSCE